MSWDAESVNCWDHVEPIMKHSRIRNVIIAANDTVVAATCHIIDTFIFLRDFTVRTVKYSGV